MYEFLQKTVILATLVILIVQYLVCPLSKVVSMEIQFPYPTVVTSLVILMLGELGSTVKSPAL